VSCGGITLASRATSWPAGLPPAPYAGTLTIRSKGALGFVSNADPTRVVQSSVSQATRQVVQLPGGAQEARYHNASQFFGSQTIGFDGMYRCVSITILATPAS
jgi:hypothetical protein